MVVRLLPIFMSFCILAVSSAKADGVNDILGLSLKDLKNLKVTSVSKKQESSFEAAAAVHVITSEDIRRSGATHIPDALRMVPGVDVAQIDANKWAITVRGFNAQFSNKLLVLIDGMSVYTPLFSGVYWDIRDTLLEDVARIEVIRGPGATLWGSNAVNGIINIITKSAKNTQGQYFSVLAGNQEAGTIEYRYGGKTDDGVNYRVFAKHFQRDESEILNSNNGSGDEWESSRIGFKADWDANSRDKFTVTAETYSGNEDQTLHLPSVTTGAVTQHNGDEDFKGFNVIAKWNRQLSADSDFTLQAYVDLIERNISILDQQRVTYDLDFQHSFKANENNDIIWGSSLRYISDDLDEKVVNGATYLDYTPNNDDFMLYSAFIQDKITVIPEKMFVTLGSKFEHNYYTGAEWQPSIRASWLPDDKQTIWGAISRASRTPTRGEDSVVIQLGGTATQEGSDSYVSEILTSYEIGYRYQPTWKASFDITAFFNDYNHLREFPRSGVSAVADNGADAEAYGIELATRFSMNRDWNLYANYSYFKVDVHRSDNFFSGTSVPALLGLEQAFDPENDEGTAPRNKLSIISRYNLPHNLELDMNAYYVDNVTTHSIDNYIRFDTRLGWKPRKGVELSLVGQNLFDDKHEEFNRSLFSVDAEIPRSFYGRATFKF